MRRCFELARRGSGYVSPNPLVGAVLVHNERIIGEGYHERYGTSHAEVRAIESVREEHRTSIKASTLYVSLEPCNHHGQTPPCTERIIEESIPRVVLSVRDPNPSVCGQSIEHLRKHGIEVECGILEREGHHLIRAFETGMNSHRPYIQLKYAVSRDGFFGIEGNQVWLSAPYMSPLVHRWRHEADCILVGRKTAEIDNPALTNRNYFGTNPTRLLIDRSLSVNQDAKLFDDTASTIVFNDLKDEVHGTTTFCKLDFNGNVLSQILEFLYDRDYRSIMVEGGARTIQSFLSSGRWDETIMMQADTFLGSGISAPRPERKPDKVYRLGKERVFYYRNKSEL